MGRACIAVCFRNSWGSGGDLFVAINGFPEDNCYHSYDKGAWRGFSLPDKYSLLPCFIFLTQVRVFFFFLI